MNFEFIRGGITIIVGENNIGKTNILDYIYGGNKNWDGFEVNEEIYTEEESQEGFVYGHRDSSTLFKLFFSDPDYPSPYLFHSSNPRFAEKPKKGAMLLSYKIYYFDLIASTSFLTEQGRRELELKKVKFRNHQVFYGKIEEEKKLKINYFRDYFVIESKGKPKEGTKPWKPSFNNEENFIKYLEGDNSVYHGFNKSISHPLDKLGSGYLKYETINSLIEDLRNERQRPTKESEIYYKTSEDEWKRRPYPVFAHTPILLMDEPEIFLHPSFIAELANTIKKAGEKNVTTILTTHSPTFLSHFISELFADDEVSLIILQKNEDGKIRTPLLYLDRIIEEIKKEIVEKEEGVWKSYCPCFKGEMESDNKLYYNKWKIILNEHTLKVFFSKNVLFVEGMTEYVFFTSELIRREIPEIRAIEVIPMFGKLNYIFFSKLAQKIGIKYRFLLDKDNSLIEEAKRIENGEAIGTKLKSCEHKPKKCTQQQVHKAFWDIHTKGKLEEEKESIIYDNEGEIDWFRNNIEYFLEVEPKDKFMISKELAMLNKINSLKESELNQGEKAKLKKWKEASFKLKKVIEKIIVK